MARVMLFLLVVGSLALGACNTFKGLGRDMQAAGNWMSGRGEPDHIEVQHEYRATDY